jgi:WD40 repeat protein
MLAASSDTIYLADKPKGTILMEQPARLSTEFSPDGRILVSISSDGTACCGIRRRR